MPAAVSATLRGDVSGSSGDNYPVRPGAGGRVTEKDQKAEEVDQLLPLAKT